MARGPFFAFRVSFVAVAVACALLLPFSVYSHIEVVKNGFGAKAVPVKAVLVNQSHRLTIEFDYTSPAHMDSAVRSFNVTVSGGGIALNNSAPMIDSFYRGETRRMYATVEDAAALSTAATVEVAYSFEVYVPYRDSTSLLTGSAVMPLEVHA